MSDVHDHLVGRRSGAAARRWRLWSLGEMLSVVGQISPTVETCIVHLKVERIAKEVEVLFLLHVVIRHSSSTKDLQNVEHGERLTVSAQKM